MPLIIHAACLSLLIPHSPHLYVWFSGRFYRQLYVTAISCLECYQTDMTSLLRSHEVRAMFFFFSLRAQGCSYLFSSPSVRVFVSVCLSYLSLYFLCVCVHVRVNMSSWPRIPGRLASRCFPGKRLLGNLGRNRPG